MDDNEKLYARVTLEVDVYLGYEEGRNDPICYEAPYEYLVVREAEMTGVQFHGHPGAGILVEHGGADDFDPDSVLVESVKGALIPSLHEPEEVSA